jgi:hypothetical protein
MKNYISAMVVVVMASGILWSAPSKATMKQLGRQAAAGDFAAIDKIEEIHKEIYKGVISCEKDGERINRNFGLMTSAFDEIIEKLKYDSFSDPAFQSLTYALSKAPLVYFSAEYLGKVAENGHKPALDVLLNYPPNDAKFLAVVSALRKPADKGNEQAIDYLVTIISNPIYQRVWHRAAQGLIKASEEGNDKAKAALKEYYKYRKDRS